MAQEAVIRVEGVTKQLPLGKVMIDALRGVDMTVYKGEMVGLVGPSGSGKSTLLGILGGLDAPTAGRVEIAGIDTTRLGEGRMTEVRNENIGFIFQFFNLIPTLTALENVMLPIQFARKRQFNPAKRARELLKLLGLGDRMHHRPSELSGGQQQRVAIARALANNPPLILADEPTGNLDTESGKLVLDTLRQIREESGTTVLLVTHDPDIAAGMDRVLTLVDGRIVEHNHVPVA
ncbi:MAG: ABC transporter ATP-binding protein [Chloroflexi bacterium]|jgi:putative ABC transport system ATP-binding protein|nr:MAG: putative ABC transporter ATP-binding protein [Chloroflexi bacterium OLB13]MBC6956199.1 ABC transporter ATP-binding protein [Chloroflexota bacterium]MBV6436187.1 Lipoprotein-releasing system ATP-binding protein LolD [Anaerolineae bacterium]MDL1915025.1 ABC transporter ATP-binding protein [Anaerolineae bacterium CFX4]MBW7879630.1 ABC transporter ATP-binding protein [Anaerolineae bacterium]